MAGAASTKGGRPTAKRGDPSIPAVVDAGRVGAIIGAEDDDTELVEYRGFGWISRARTEALRLSRNSSTRATLSAQVAPRAEEPEPREEEEEETPTGGWPEWGSWRDARGSQSAWSSQGWWSSAPSSSTGWRSGGEWSSWQ